jgi:uncharacterized protein (TIGR03067 family)
MTPLVLGLALAIGAPAPKKADEPAPGKLEGEWVVESFEGPKDDTPPGSITMRIGDGKISIHEGKRDRAEDAGYTADPSKKPATIDIRPEKGAPKEKVILGIYEVKGDTLKLCFGRDTGERPTEFQGDAAKGVMMITLKRVKPEK